jgi:hypothetical protein
MGKKTPKKKLQINKQTVRTLSTDDLERAKGGLMNVTRTGTALNCPCTENMCTIIKGGTTNHNQNFLRRR